MKEVDFAFKLLILLFSIMNASVGCLLDRRNVCMERRLAESLQNRHKPLKAILPAMGLEAVNVAPIDFRSPAVDDRSEFGKIWRITVGFRLLFCFFLHA
jgi:hypothetical protein